MVPFVVAGQPHGPEATVPELVEDNEAVGNAVAEIDRAEAILVVLVELFVLEVEVHLFEW
jgi:hypothetical protein